MTGRVWPLVARLSQCPRRSESDRSAALPRIDGLCQNSGHRRLSLDPPHRRVAEIDVGTFGHSPIALLTRVEAFRDDLLANLSRALARNVAENEVGAGHGSHPTRRVVIPRLSWRRSKRPGVRGVVRALWRWMREQARSRRWRASGTPPASGARRRSAAP